MPYKEYFEMNPGITKKELARRGHEIRKVHGQKIVALGRKRKGAPMLLQARCSSAIGTSNREDEDDGPPSDEEQSDNLEEKYCDSVEKRQTEMQKDGG